MSLLKNLLKPFVEFEEDPKGAGQQPEPKGPPAKPAAAVVPPPVPKPAEGPEFNDAHFQPTVVPVPVTQNPFLKDTAPLPPSGTAGPLPEHRQHFEQLIEEANAKNPLFTGTDYKEFIDSKIDLSTIPDEATRYQTAFNVLKRTGLTKDKLLATGREYIHIIGRDMNGFQSAYAQRYVKEVKQKVELAWQKTAEAEALAQKIAALQQEINALAEEAGKARAGLDAAKHSYLMAGEQKQQEILTELQKIEQFF